MPANNYIDELVYDKLQQLRIQPSELCTDAEFIRRVSLDVCGVLPTSAETEQFIADADPAKREKLVDKLLARKEFVELWVMKWSELLQIRSNINVSYKATLLYYNWLQEQIASNVPIDEMVQEAARLAGRHVQQPGHELLPDRAGPAEDGRERGPGVHGHADSVCPVPQPSVRSLDDGRLLRLRGVLRADRPQAGRRSARDDRLQLGRRRGESSRRRPRDAAQVSRRRGARLQGPRSPRSAGRVAGVAREPVLRQEPGQHRLGPLLRPRHRRPGRRRAGQQSARERPAARRAGASTSPNTSTTSSDWCAISARRAPISSAR